jgi:hypothetical protein
VGIRGCDPYDEFLKRPLGMEFGIGDCWAPTVGPADWVGGVFALLGMFLVARFSDWPPERAAISVGVLGTLLAAFIGFGRSGLDPFWVFTDPGFYFSLPVTITFGVILEKLERRRRTAASFHQREQQ